MRVIYILFVIYILYRLFFNFVLPLVARHFFQKAAQNMQGDFGRYQQQQAPPRRAGEVRIEDPASNASKKKFSSDDVEDVDFIEVK